MTFHDAIDDLQENEVNGGSVIANTSAPSEIPDNYNLSEIRDINNAFIWRNYWKSQFGFGYQTAADLVRLPEDFDLTQLCGSDAEKGKYRNSFKGRCSDNHLNILFEHAQIKYDRLTGRIGASYKKEYDFINFVIQELKWEIENREPQTKDSAISIENGKLNSNSAVIIGPSTVDLDVNTDFDIAAARDIKEIKLALLKISQSKNIFDSGQHLELLDFVRDKLENSLARRIAEGSFDEDTAKTTALRCLGKYKDVLAEIEEVRKARSGLLRPHAIEILSEITCNPKTLIFPVGDGYLVKDGDNFHFCNIDKKDWPTAIGYMVKYHQDRGDPWRGLVKAFGSHEFVSMCDAAFRQNSIRSRAAGHDEAYLVSEITTDVTQQARSNYNRGYVAVEVYECNQQGQFIDKHGKPILSLETKEDRDRLVKTQIVVWSSSVTTSKKTPPPETFIQKFDVDAYKDLKWPDFNDSNVVDPYGGRMRQPAIDDGPKFGVYIPKDKTGKVIDDLVYTSELIEIPEDRLKQANILVNSHGTMESEPIMRVPPRRSADEQWKIINEELESRGFDSSARELAHKKFMEQNILQAMEDINKNGPKNLDTPPATNSGNRIPVGMIP